MHVNMALVAEVHGRTTCSTRPSTEPVAGAARRGRRRVPLRPGPDPRPRQDPVPRLAPGLRARSPTSRTSRASASRPRASSTLLDAPRRPSEDQQHDLDFLLTLGELFTLVALRPADPRAGAADRPRPTTSSTRSSTCFVRDFSRLRRRAARQGVVAPRPSRPGRSSTCASPSSTPSASARVFEQVAALSGAYEMRP